MLCISGSDYSTILRTNVAGPCPPAPGNFSDIVGCSSDTNCQEVCNADSNCHGYIDAKEGGYMTKNYVSGCFEEHADFVLRVKPGVATKYAPTLNLDLPSGSQYKIMLTNTNQDSNIPLDYELTVIRPHPMCTEAQLSGWYPA